MRNVSLETKSVVKIRIQGVNGLVPRDKDKSVLFTRFEFLDPVFYFCFLFPKIPLLKDKTPLPCQCHACCAQ